MRWVHARQSHHEGDLHALLHVGIWHFCGKFSCQPSHRSAGRVDRRANQAAQVLACAPMSNVTSKACTQQEGVNRVISESFTLKHAPNARRLRWLIAVSVFRKVAEFGPSIKCSAVLQRNCVSGRVSRTTHARRDKTQCSDTTPLAILGRCEQVRICGCFLGVSADHMVSCPTAKRQTCAAWRGKRSLKCARSCISCWQTEDGTHREWGWCSWKRMRCVWVL